MRQDYLTDTCVIKAVPDAVRAAHHAIAVHPQNRPATALEGITPNRLAVRTSKYWGPRDRTLAVSFLDTSDPALRNRILAHMNAWYDLGSCVKFAWTAGVGTIRVSRDSTGYWSYLGTDNEETAEDEATMNLEGFTMATSEATYRRVVRHETGHALGFEHEHLREEIIRRVDEAKALDYFMRTQGWDAAAVRNNVLDPLEKTSIMASELADEMSVMCYWLPGEIMRNGIAVRGGSDISPTDRIFANQVYPAVSIGVSTVELLKRWWADFLGRWNR
jgi:hypothetical protein